MIIIDYYLYIIPVYSIYKNIIMIMDWESWYLHFIATYIQVYRTQIVSDDV